MDYRLHHQGTENRSSKERPIVYIAYARAWFTDLVNYGNNVRINIDESDLATVPPKHHSLFRRLAARGAFDRPIDALFNQTH